ncbi:hypothetical protein B7P43_G08115 [Cryptotermes secundus]|uniref:Endonuclease/exonuclease/phosphatase domain-containing protein n=1 Tax=Cryptotermes secundus TaxID=105785 RepID=A0A2J7PVU9_9NEOP|nr:hypothetical protein B7P43_G08115 [Cryptotermes secundus]
MKITAIQDIIMDLKRHTVFSSGKAEGNKECGVAFVIEREFKRAIIVFKPISERMCTLRIRTRFSNMTLMNVHAPTEEKEEEGKDYFYQQMEETYDSIPSNDIKVILGDPNAKIAPKEKKIGTESLHDITNHNGIKLIVLHSMKKGFKPKTAFIREKKGLLINNKTELKEYFEQLLNQNQNMEHNEDNEEENADDGEGEEEEIIEPPTKEEVEEAVKEQKLNKAPGGDNIPAELLKAGGQEGTIALHRIINKVWEEEKIPEDWGKSSICPKF